MRWDTFNSQYLISRGRGIYSKYICSIDNNASQPKGVVINTINGNGKIVYEVTRLLLPREIFLGIEELFPRRIKKSRRSIKDN